MKPLSPRAAELVAALLRPPSWRERLLGRQEEDSVLLELRSIDEPAVVPRLLPFAFGDDARAQAVAATLHRIVAACAPAELVALDEACRRGWYDADPRESLRPADVARFAARGEVGVTLAGLASFHPSGYVREAAVAELDAASGGSELAFLLPRLNDWVEPVARRAAEAIRRRLTTVYTPWLVRNLAILAKLARSSRRDHAALVAASWALLRAPETRGALSQGFRSNDPETRRLAYRLVREGAVDDLAQVLELALGAPDPAVRLEAARDARARLDDEALRRLLPVLERDRFMPVRREAMLAGVERFPADAAERLERALLDRHRSVRELARFTLRQRAPAYDAAAFYRRAVSSRPVRETLPAALAGLGEVGEPRDAELVQPFLSDERTSVRAAALRALARLDFERHQPVFAAALTDARAGVSRAARDVLRARPAAIGVDALREALHGARPPHAKRNALALSDGLGKWDCLSLLLEAVAGAEPELQEAARQRLRAWVARANRRFVTPTRRQLDDVATWLERSHSALEPAVGAELTAVVRDWSRRLAC